MKISNTKLQNERDNLSERLLNFAAAVIKIVVLINRTAVGRHIGGQLTRSATSSGATYEEACGAESRAGGLRNNRSEKSYFIII
jgi:four helix bundle protein